MQMLHDMLGAKASTDDELIEQHLKTLAKQTVHIQVDCIITTLA